GLPDRMASATAQQATEGASGPEESRLVDSGTMPWAGSRLAVGLNPVTPQNAAGVRTEPPVSVPNEMTDMSSATATPAPEEDPPAIRPVWRPHGQLGEPWCGLMPTPEKANSDMLVRPTRIPPASIRRWTSVACA